MRSLLLLVALAALAAASSQDCDPLAPDYCLYPFPNNFWTAPDASTDTGLRLALAQSALPVSTLGNKFDASEFNDILDGFSSFMPIQTYIPKLNLTQTAGWSTHLDPSVSLASDSPTVLLDTSTGELVPHWMELDFRSNKSDLMEPQRSLMIWPAHRLNDATRYIVGLRNLKLHDGSAAQPSDAFKALRDGLNSSDPNVNNRRKLFADIFERLDKVGFKQADLTLAWDFTTGSSKSIHGRLLFTRDDSAARLPPTGPRYRITGVQDHPTSYYSARTVKGVFYTPIYLDSSKPGGTLVLNSSGIPQYQGLAAVNFTATLPWSVANGSLTGRLVQYGHGLFSTQAEVEQEYLRDWGNRYGYVMFATNWWGLDHEDIAVVAKMMLTDLSKFTMVPDGLVQGVTNALNLMKLFKGDIINAPAMKFDGVDKAWDPSHAFYNGNSLGGIMGSVYMAYSQDVTRGVLGVAGAPFSLLLPRSSDFQALWDMLEVRYENSMDRMVIFQLLQLLWDHADPGSILNRVTSNPLPNTPVKNIVLQFGLGDAQVTWLGDYNIIRSMNLSIFPHHSKQPGEELKLMTVEQPPLAPGSNAAVCYHYLWVPSAPFYNIPASKKTDTHELTRRQVTGQEQLNIFFSSGEIRNECDDWACVVSQSNQTTTLFR